MDETKNFLMDLVNIDLYIYLSFELCLPNLPCIRLLMQHDIRIGIHRVHNVLLNRFIAFLFITFLNFLLLDRWHIANAYLSIFSKWISITKCVILRRELHLSLSISFKCVEFNSSFWPAFFLLLIFLEVRLEFHLTVWQLML